MEIKWTSKALSDLVRLYDFLAPVNKRAAATVVQALTTAPLRLKEHPYIGEKLEAFEPREVRRTWWDTTRCVTKSISPAFICCESGIQEKTDRFLAHDIFRSVSRALKDSDEMAFT